ncbi:DUF3923 family protein [Oenococcus oeni]
MKLWRNVSLGITVLFVVGALFIWFRKADAAGVKKTFAYQVIGLSIWVILFLVILIGMLIWHHLLKK